MSIISVFPQSVKTPVKPLEFINFENGFVTGTGKPISNVGGVTIVDSDRIGGTKTAFLNNYSYLTFLNSALVFPNDFTLEFWTKPNVQTRTNVMIIADNNGDTSTYGIWYQFPAALSPSQTTFSNAGGALFGTGELLPIGVWTHIATQRRNNNLDIYINGVLKATRVVNGTISMADTVISSIPKHPQGNIYFYQGYVSDVYFYNVAKYSSNFIV